MYATNLAVKSRCKFVTSRAEIKADKFIVSRKFRLVAAQPPATAVSYRQFRVFTRRESFVGNSPEELRKTAEILCKYAQTPG